MFFVLFYQICMVERFRHYLFLIDVTFCFTFYYSSTVRHKEPFSFRFNQTGDKARHENASMSQMHYKSAQVNDCTLTSIMNVTKNCRLELTGIRSDLSRVLINGS